MFGVRHFLVQGLLKGQQDLMRTWLVRVVGLAHVEQKVIDCIYTKYSLME